MSANVAWWREPTKAQWLSFGAAWLAWVLDALLHSPEEQQTELVARHFAESAFHRFEPQLPADIDMDDIGRIADLEEAGKRFAEEVDWDLILRVPTGGTEDLAAPRIPVQFDGQPSH